jgi:hypothetical protein
MLRRFFQRDYVPLGRWTRTTRVLNAIKIDWANTDHCGTCTLPHDKNPKDETNSRAEVLLPDLKKSDEKNRNE